MCYLSIGHSGDKSKNYTQLEHFTCLILTLNLKLMWFPNETRVFKPLSVPSSRPIFGYVGNLFLGRYDNIRCVVM
jgi:hypothetical protein